MKKLAIWTGVVAFAVTFGFGGAVKIAQASHSGTFCTAHPLHPHCPPTGGDNLNGIFRAPLVANGTCVALVCVGANVDDECTDNTQCQGEVDGTASLTSLGVWRVNTTGLTHSESPNDNSPGNHDICLVFERLGGGGGRHSLNRDTQTNAAGDFVHDGRIDQFDGLSGTIVELFILIFHDPGQDGDCEAAGTGGSVAQITGLTITPF